MKMKISSFSIVDCIFWVLLIISCGKLSEMHLGLFIRIKLFIGSSVMSDKQGQWQLEMFYLLIHSNTLSSIYCITQPIRRTFFPKKCDLNSTCILCAKGKYYFQTYKYPYIYYTTPLSWDSEICFQIMRSGITACERLTFLSRDLP